MTQVPMVRLWARLALRVIMEQVSRMAFQQSQQILVLTAIIAPRLVVLVVTVAVVPMPVILE